MAYNPQQVDVGKIAPFESKTTSYLQDLQKAKDARADKEKAEARLALQDQRVARQDERVALQDQLTAKERIAAAENRAAMLKEQQEQSALAREVSRSQLKTLEDERIKEEAAKRDRGILGTTSILGTEGFMFGPNVSEELKAAQTNITRLEGIRSANLDALNTAKSYLGDGGGLSTQGQKEFDTRYNAYAKTLSPEDAKTKAMEDVKAIAAKAMASTYEEDSSDVINQAKNAFMRQYQQIAPTVEEYAKTGIALLKKSGYSAPYSEDALTALTNRAKALGLKSEADYKTDAETINKSILEKRQKEIDNKKEYYKLVSDKIDKANSGGSIKYTDWLEAIEDLGRFDKGDAVELFTTLRKDTTLDKVSNSDIQKAILMTTTKRLWGDAVSLNATKPEELKKVADVARALSTGSTGSEILESKFELGELPTTSREELLRSRFKTSPLEDLARSLKIDLSQPLNIPPRSALDNPHTITDEEKAAEDLRAQEEARNRLFHPRLYNHNPYNIGNALRPPK